jgi:hypothetical protein
MDSDTAAEKTAADEFVVLASFADRKAAEHMVMALGHTFRKVARKGRASALVVSANSDGSLKLTQSRAETAGNFTAAAIRVPVAWMVGFLGMFSTLKGTRAATHAARVRQGSVGADEHAAHTILADAGEHSAIVLIRSQDRDLWQQVGTEASNRAINSWSGSMTEFRSALDPGSEHDWVRAALDVNRDRKRHG